MPVLTKCGPPVAASLLSCAPDSLAALHERSDAEYRRAIQAGAGTLEVPALLRLAARMKRAGEHVGAAELWRVAAKAGNHEALRELAIHHEHRTRDWPAALDLVEEALNRLTPASHPPARRLAEDLRRRRERLFGRLARRPHPSSQGGQRDVGPPSGRPERQVETVARPTPAAGGPCRRSR